jgi:zinc carboxypeptidase
MRGWLLGSLVAAVIAGVCVGLAPTTAKPEAPGRDPDQLDAYTVTVAPSELSAIAQQGYDVSGQRVLKSGAVRLDLVLDQAQANKLQSQGVRVKLTRVKGGQTVRQFAAAQAVGGYNVWRSYDEPGGIRDQLYAAARQNPQLVKLEVLGHTAQGREIIAVKLTQGARGTPDGSRPAVLYSATQHAREWISTEVDRRLMNYYIDQWRANNRDVRKLLQTTELWFMPVANPDGYQYTFDSVRLWRKNLRDNNGDGVTQVGDGVDPNRNFPAHWGWDEEGSSSIQSSDTYRGPAPGSEPETKAMTGLLDRIKFKFQVNYHSNGQWLLYPEGWQTSTPSADDPIYYAMSGNLDNPAIKDFHPGLSSDVLYVTNGETTDYAHSKDGTLAWTPELSAGCDGCGFVFPDDEQLVQAEFERNLPFAKSVANSATDPDDPKTVTGITTKPFYIDSADPYKRSNPGTQLSFTKSYGDPQTVAVIAKRSLGAVTVRYSINGGPTQSAPTSEWEGGSRYDPASVYYHQMRGVVTGTDPGDSVKVWFTGGGKTSDSFTYKAVSESGNRVLVVAAEDYTGASPVQTPGPHFAQTYVDALAANGEQADVYDVDDGRLAPDALGVLSHYDAVIWETGNDLVTRTAGRGAGNADLLALDEILQFRSYMNEGGKVLFAGDSAGQQYTNNVGNQLYDPKGEVACNPPPAGIDTRRCLPLWGSFGGGDQVQDVLQYYFGAYLSTPADGLDDNGAAFDAFGTGDPFAGLSWGLDDPVQAGNATRRSSFIATSGVLPVDQFKQFESAPAARYDKPGSPFDPHTGSHYVYSQIADVSYKRLTREVAVPQGGGSLTFWTSYDTEPAWDHLFVEARTPGQNNWTTLPDANGNTTTDTGESCKAENSGGWRTIHPQMDFYQTQVGTASCNPTGSNGGAWNAASGNSGGWQQWSVDLSDYANQNVEISIAYASDWATQGLGVFIDDVTLPDGTSTSFENGLDGWSVTGPPPGSAPNANNFEVTDASGFPVGNTIATPNSLLMGFGLEGVSTQAERNEVMKRALDHLLG